MNNIFEKFKLNGEKENHQNIITTISNGVVFRGTNLWVLIFAIFVASLGLNVNSTAVIIGAMLISPLMGPIMGIGLAIGINDILLLRKSLSNYAIATMVALITSTIFFLISPLDDAHSEILARTAPTIYDVLIALFGGFAGIIATSSKLKGNVIPGVAIATALMPPLCTAGYGLATFQIKFFIGAFYLFIINTVFIALATFIISRLLKFPYKHLLNQQSERMAKAVIWLVVIITLIPSIYLGYDLVERNRFSKNANRFIENEANFPNDYLLNKKINARNRIITLVYGGEEIDSGMINNTRSQLKKYGLSNTELEIKQGFAYLSENIRSQQKEQSLQMTMAMDQQELTNKKLKAQLDSIVRIDVAGRQLYRELKAQYPEIKNAIIEPVSVLTDSSRNTAYFVMISIRMLNRGERTRMHNWLKTRLNTNNVQLNIQP